MALLAYDVKANTRQNVRVFPPFTRSVSSRRSARAHLSPRCRDAMHCGRCVASMLLLVSHTEALLTGIATPRRHGAVSVQANLLTKVRAGPDAAQSTRPRVQPWPFQRGAARIPVQALVILTLGRTLTSSLPAHPGEPSLL